MQMQVAEVDDETQRLAKDEDRVFPMDGIDGEHQPTSNTEVPEGNRDDDLLGLFARPPLDDKAHHEQRLPAKADADPAPDLKLF